MGKFTKKWLKDFEKRYKNTLKEIQSLESEYAEMVETNPDEYQLVKYFPIDNLTFNNACDLSIFHQEKTDDSDESVEIGINGSSLVGFSFIIKSLKDLIEFRNKLMEAIDKFQRPLEEEKVDYSDMDECDDYEEDDEYHEYTIKAEQPLTQSWTYTVTARSACEAIKMVEEDNYQDGVVNNDDNEYYDYGEIEYESI